MKKTQYKVKLGLLGVALFSLAALKLAQEPEIERPLAIVTRFIPSVEVTNGSYPEPKELDPDASSVEQLFDGDTLKTDAKGYALVHFMDNSLAKVKPNSTLIVRGQTERASKKSNTRIDLNLGEILLEVEPQGVNDFEVSTNRSLASVKGTEFGGKANGYYWVKEGHVDVTALNSGQQVSLFARMFAQVDNLGNNIDTGTLTEEALEQLNQGYDEIEDELIRKEMKLRFRDANGQIREMTIEYYEKGDGQ